MKTLYARFILWLITPALELSRRSLESDRDLSMLVSDEAFRAAAAEKKRRDMVRVVSVDGVVESKRIGEWRMPFIVNRKGNLS